MCIIFSALAILPGERKRSNVLKLATLDDGSAAVVAGDRYARLPGDLRDYLGRASKSISIPPLARWASLDEAHLRAPIQPGKIICIGLNYSDHVTESGFAHPRQPLLFGKLPSATIGHGGNIVKPSWVTRLDYEAELAVVIGREGKDISADDAFDYIGGFACFNDVTDRDAQFGDGQWFRGKSLDTFAPFGPWVVTPDEIEEPHDLLIECTVNGEARQRSTTRNLIFSIPEIISYCSRGITLKPGDVLATGTPAGAGMASDRWLADGDVVDVRIQGIGTLRNTVRAATASESRT